MYVCDIFHIFTLFLNSDAKGGDYLICFIVGYFYYLHLTVPGI